MFMNKISMFLIILIMSSVPFAFAHPYIDHAHLLTEGQEITVEFIGLNDKEKVDDESVEFLSTAWFWQNFILLLKL